MDLGCMLGHSVSPCEDCLTIYKNKHMKKAILPFKSRATTELKISVFPNFNNWED